MKLEAEILTDLMHERLNVAQPFWMILDDGLYIELWRIFSMIIYIYIYPGLYI